ncbi:hypothetical protein CKAN_02293200 [Cinnamomum micranthum f. kanehirae]|uniref:Uncharacterized protein n=1 Tax=Cinnamomum micranthum f. kanehirae TaxID=337451 RepID=A0A443PSA5_9MAGN|nr:hypothetical protein CKAN_02293200 [Cinnamomum micranthum f. kanehirae]
MVRIRMVNNKIKPDAERQTERQGKSKRERVADLQCSSTRALVFISYFIGLVLSLIESSAARFWKSTFVAEFQSIM